MRLSDLLYMLGRVDAVLGPYYLFMFGWIRVFGDSELSLRMPSILGVALAAGLTAQLGRRLFDARTGLLAGLLLAGLPAMSRYASRGRA
jgi:mannosyltransferase